MAKYLRGEGALMRLLVVEDEKKVAGFVKKGLEGAEMEREWGRATPTY